MDTKEDQSQSFPKNTISDNYSILRYPIKLTDKKNCEKKQEDEMYKNISLENYFADSKTSSSTNKPDLEKLQGKDVFLSGEIKSEPYDRMESQMSPEIVHFVNCKLNDGKITKSWECGICGRLFQHQYTLMRHMPTHTNIRNFKCDECGKAFRQLSTLMQHKAIHSADRPHECSICNKSFNRVSTLISHKKIHSGKKTYICEICNKGFHQKGNLRNHVYTHTNSRPYKCSYCEQGFNQKSNLVCHIQKVHKTDLNWLCTICDQKFMKLSDLHAHEYETHNLRDAINIPENSQANVASNNLNNIDTNLTNAVIKVEKSDIIVIPAITTSAMITAKARNETPSAVLHLANGNLVLVCVLDCGDDKNALKVATASDYPDSTDCASPTVLINIVASIFQYYDEDNNSLFKVLPPNKNYKLENDEHGARILFDNTFEQFANSYSQFQDIDTVLKDTGTNEILTTSAVSPAQSLSPDTLIIDDDKLMMTDLSLGLTTSAVSPERSLSPGTLIIDDDKLMLTDLSLGDEFFCNDTKSSVKSTTDENELSDNFIKNEYWSLCDEMESYIKNTDSPMPSDFFSDILCQEYNKID